MGACKHTGVGRNNHLDTKRVPGGAHGFMKGPRRVSWGCPGAFVSLPHGLNKPGLEMVPVPRGRGRGENPGVPKTRRERGTSRSRRVVILNLCCG